MHSAVQKIILASKHLPDQLKVIFEAIFKQNKSPEQVCSDLGISMEDFNSRHRQMMREIRSI